MSPINLISISVKYFQFLPLNFQLMVNSIHDTAHKKSATKIISGSNFNLLVRYFLITTQKYSSI